MLKNNSQVCCIKNFVDDEHTYMKFDGNKIYNVKSLTDKIIIVSFCEDPKWANNIAFKFSNVVGLDILPIFENYFMELKEYRKQKLSNINLYDRV